MNAIYFIAVSALPQRDRACFYAESTPSIETPLKPLKPLKTGQGFQRKASIHAGLKLLKPLKPLKPVKKQKRSAEHKKRPENGPQ